MKTRITRYKNRKLYNTTTQKYINLPELLTLPDDSYVIIDHATRLDITPLVLLRAQIERLSMSNNPAAVAAQLKGIK